MSRLVVRHWSRKPNRSRTTAASILGAKNPPAAPLSIKPSPHSQASASRTGVVESRKRRASSMITTGAPGA